MASVIERERVGVVLEGEHESEVQKAAERLHALNADSEVAEPMQGCSPSLFSLEEGVAAYRELYASLAKSEQPGF